METVKFNVDNSKLEEELSEEVEIREKIKSGEEIEITEAIEILKMIKNNYSLEEISKKTNKPISDIIKIKKIFNL